METCPRHFQFGRAPFGLHPWEAVEDMNKKNRKKWLLIPPALLLLLIGAAAFFINAKLDRIQYVPANETAPKFSSPAASQPADDSEVDLPDIPYSSGSSSISAPPGAPFSKEGVFNILLLGTDERTNGYNDFARADSIMLVSLNEKQKTIKLVSLERGIGVPIPGSRQDDWLTHTFEYGGAALTLSTVQNCFKVKVDRYLRLDFVTFPKVIDAMGGIDMDLSPTEAEAVNNDLTYYMPTEPHVTAGVCHIDGGAALEFCRVRDIDSDWQRIERQRRLVQAVINRAKSLSPIQLNAFADATLPLLQTNLTKLEIAGLLVQAPGLAGKQAAQMTIPQKGTYWGQVGMGGRDMIAIDFAKNDAILQDFLYGDSAAAP